MGTRFAAVFFAPAELDTTQLGGALARTVASVDEEMSTFRPQSNLMQLNRAPVGAWFPVPPELFAVLEHAAEIGRLSDGAFDIGVGDLVLAWGFGPAAGRVDADEIARARRVPYVAAHVCLDFDRTRRRVRKLSGINLDLSGIAKGYGVDALADILEAHGIRRYLVSIDGELRAGEPKPGGAPWTVALESPEPGYRRPAAILELERAALATSGDYRQFVEHGGRRHPHTMNPWERCPLASGPTSVTVRARSCAEADAWATAFMVLDPKRRIELASEHGLDVLVTGQE